ncbi:MAG TPA: alpha/beta fold hydrolase [Ornithinimicrobium sp.]|uniref:S9 family peptidase n=1 Tax=Ornithinimicrobium sp. TaxID=1977084 RepID=UPI002B492D1B|nr:alpha/beta fold hydrolase [Ornithinimicrobium sp.]HKJ10990.1 alpha/beta fold hydrolase [Ornithinimicrobium sp.]
MSPATSAGTSFHDLDDFVGYPRVGDIAVSPDGSRLVATVTVVNAEGTDYVSALWEIDPTGHRPAHRLTRGTEGESAPVFTSTGDLLFSSKRRPAQRNGEPEDDSAGDTSLWQLDAAGGEAHPLVVRPGGVTLARCASAADLTVVVAPVLPGAHDERQHAALHRQRQESDVDAILHQGYPVRFWDRDLGPAQPRLFTIGADGGLSPLSGHLGAALVEHEPQVGSRGRFVLTTASVPEHGGAQRTVLLSFDVVSGEESRVVDIEGFDVEAALISPDSTRALVSMGPQTTPSSAPAPTLFLLDLQTGARTAVAEGWDRWGTPGAWLSDGSGVLVLADDQGRGPVFCVDADSGDIRQITTDDATYSSVLVAPQAEDAVAYAVRSSPAFPSEVVRIDVASGEVTALPGPVARPELPGELTEVTATAQDGRELRAWLALPGSGNGPAPLLVFVHGGPLSSWNAWTWRWNPWVMAARGYAVLLPDPALSTGYGQEFVQRGWGAWGEAPYTDILALTDAAVARADVDSERTAAMGGSFGGYMANWIAGHTDRFDAIVTHASLWALDAFGPTTDASFYWAREMTEQMALDNSPHRFVDQISTPMLVVHGDKDYRVPIGEGLRLWYELLSGSALPAEADGTTAHRFLYFPHENHWVLKPQHAKVWYAVVTAFLSEHLLGTPTPPPHELGLTPAQE